MIQCIANKALIFPYSVSDFDKHWLPFYSCCDPCRVMYTHIVKFESLVEEEPLVHAVLGVAGAIGGTKR